MCQRFKHSNPGSNKIGTELFRNISNNEDNSNKAVYFGPSEHSLFEYTVFRQSFGSCKAVHCTVYRYTFLKATGQPGKQCKKLWAEGFCPTHPTNITKLCQNTVNSLNTVCNKQSEFFILSMTELMCTGHKPFCTNLNDFRTSNLRTSFLTVKWVPML